MAAYCIFEVGFTERAWRREYVPPTLELIKKHGGRALAGATPEKMEGGREPPTMVILIEFPSVEAAKAWYDDPEYKPLAAFRLAHSSGEGLLVQGI